MNSKRVNRIFLAIILLHFLTVILMLVFYPVFQFDIVPNLIFSQLIVLIPALAGVLFSKENLIKLVSFRKIKLSSILMIILFCYLTMPLVTLINAISLLFVDNTVVAMSGDILNVPFGIMLFIIGIFGPFSEELVFRGIIYQGYKKSGTVLRAVLLSSLLFSLMHLNFNQAAYAIVIGAIFALLVEATGSLWSSILCHAVFNSRQVCMMYLYDAITPELENVNEMQSQMTTDMILLAISVFIIIAAITTTLAVCVLVWIAKNEKRLENLRAIWTSRKEKKKGEMITVSLLVAIVLALSYMSLSIIL